MTDNEKAAIRSALIEASEDLKRLKREAEAIYYQHEQHEEPVVEVHGYGLQMDEAIAALSALVNKIQVALGDVEPRKLERAPHPRIDDDIP
jgi:hypothetical protein